MPKEEKRGRKRGSPRKSSAAVQDPQVSSTSNSPLDQEATIGEEYFDFLNEKLPTVDLSNYRSKLASSKLKNSERWFNAQFDDVVSEQDKTALPMGLLLKIEHYAERLLEIEAELFENQKSTSRPDETSWLRNVSVGGTAGDKIAALVVQIHANPLLNLAKIDSLVFKVDKSNRREAILTAEAFRDLCSQYLLPDRKLIPFKNRPLLKMKDLSSGNRLLIERRLMLWYFESHMKSIYDDFVRRLEKVTHDSVDVNRMKAIGIMTDLLINKPENEKFLLSSIVNKLGDPSVKVASKVVTFLSRLIGNHSEMKTIVVEEVKNLVYRLHVTPKAQYYAIVFLTQMRINLITDSDLASQLIQLYFGLFKLLVEKGSMENKLLALLLRGTNKAFPATKNNKKANATLLNDINTLYKVAAVGNTNSSLQAMLLLHQVLEASEGVNDRFYTSLYRKLMEPAFVQGSSNQPLLFHLLYKTLKNDTFDGRIYAFLKRLLQLALLDTPPFACAVLNLVSELIREKPALAKFEKSSQNTSLLAWNPILGNSDDESDDEEHFRDVHGPDSESESEGKAPKNINPSWLHTKHSKSHKNNKFQYDPNNRNPMFANASSTLLYELLLLKDHYHPSVALFAQQILGHEKIEYSGDPLQDFTLIRFLDRFSYRNPKKRKNEVVSKLPKRTSYSPWDVKNVAVTSEDYAKTPAEQIPVDEKFVHKYITSFGVGESNNKAVDDNDDGSSVNSEEFNDELDRMKKVKRKRK